MTIRIGRLMTRNSWLVVVPLLMMGCDEEAPDLEGMELASSRTTGSQDPAALDQFVQCPYPQVDVPVVAPDPEAQPMAPVFMAFELVGDVAGLHLNDWQDALGASSAELTISLWSLEFVPVCRVTYDLSHVVDGPSDQTRNNMGERLLGAWDLTLSDGMAERAPGLPCGLVDPLVFGSTDVRDYLESVPWTIGIGPLDRTTPDALFDRIEDLVLPGDWVANWEPYVMGLSVSQPFRFPGRNQTFESGFGWAVEHACASWPLEPQQVGETPYHELPHQKVGDLAAGYLMRPYWAFDLLP